MNNFTAKLYDRGWQVTDFLKYWGISRVTYERISNQPRRLDELDKKIKAMGNNELIN